MFPLFGKIPKIFYKFKPYKKKLRTYFLVSGWGSKESRSEPSSVLRAIEETRKQLPIIFNKFYIHTLNDIPWKAFSWLKFVNFSGMDYFSNDIVKNYLKLITNSFLVRI